MASDPMTGAPPKVFISYSHDTIAHQERVLGLADRLRAEGIDAEIDQYNPAPPEGWALWCERQIAAADVVLMVCTETYHRRVSGDEERGKGLGVVWEARIIRQHLYDTGAVSDKFVPVLFSDASPEQIPMPIKGGTRYVVDTEHGYEELYRRLTRQPRLVRPELGAIRPLPPRRRQWTEAQSEEATTAPTPSSSAARSPEDGTVTAAGGRSVAIGGNMTGTVVTGDHNVTSITTASDHNEVRQHHLQEFSHSAECDTFIRQLRAHHTKLSNSVRRKIFLFPPICLIVWVYCILIAGYLSEVGYELFSMLFGSSLLLFYPVVAIVYFVHIRFLYSLASADVYPAIILEKHATLEKSIRKWHILLQKSDGSRKEVVINQGFNTPQWEIGVAVEKDGKLIRFTEIHNLHKTEVHDFYKGEFKNKEPPVTSAGQPTETAPHTKEARPNTKRETRSVASSWKRFGLGVVLLILDVMVFGFFLNTFHLDTNEPWWGSFLVFSVLIVAVYALVLIVSGFVGGLRGMWRKLDL